MSWKVEIAKKLSIINRTDVKVNGVSPVGGGSINDTYEVNTTEGNFFVKKNSASLYPQMFEKEALGLELLSNAKSIDTPEVIAFGESENDSFLILKFIASGSKTHSFWDDFGRQLAGLHIHSDEYFGLNHDNYIGSLYQHNNKHNNWSDFFREERLEKQVKLARNNAAIDKESVTAFDRFYARLDNIFPKEPPALLHGDLWGGNFMVSEKGNPVIIDPAVYYGHREMDLGMSQLFGGFDRQFYQSDNKYDPLENGWEERLSYCNLYPLMVHVNLFGGGYLQSVKTTLRKF